MIAYVVAAILLTSPMADAKAPEKAQAEKSAKVTSPVVGEEAPTFELEMMDGSGVFDLADYRGKTVVLEWFNPACPFVVAAHEGKKGSLSKVPATYTANGIVWVAVNSTAKGKKGSTPEENAAAKAEWKMDYPILRDPTGKVGRMYNARTTPHMFIVGPEGNLVYDGAVDNQPRGEGEGAYVNYVAQGLDEMDKGENVKTAKTKPYGCSVKYAD